MVPHLEGKARQRAQGTTPVMLGPSMLSLSSLLQLLGCSGTTLEVSRHLNKVFQSSTV